MQLEIEIELRFYQICNIVYKSNIYAFSMLFQFQRSFNYFYNVIQYLNKFFDS